MKCKQISRLDSIKKTITQWNRIMNSYRHNGVCSDFIWVKEKTYKDITDSPFVFNSCFLCDYVSDHALECNSCSMYNKWGTEGYKVEYCTDSGSVYHPLVYLDNGRKREDTKKMYKHLINNLVVKDYY